MIEAKLINRISSENDNKRFEYTRLGLLKRFKDNTGVSKIKYNSKGQLETYTYPEGDKIHYEYDDNANISSVCWDDKHSLVYTRDIFGKIILMKTSAGTFTIQRDYNKKIIQRNYPNGAYSHFTFNENGRPLQIKHIVPESNRVGPKYFC